MTERQRRAIVDVLALYGSSRAELEANEITELRNALKEEDCGVACCKGQNLCPHEKKA